MCEGDFIQDIVGPLGTPRDIEKLDCVVCVAGGVGGVAPIYPEAKAYHQLGTRVISLIGAQTKDMLIFKDRMEKVSDEVYYSTDDGSFGIRVSSLKSSMICWRKGFVLMR